MQHGEPVVHERLARVPWSLAIVTATLVATTSAAATAQDPQKRPPRTAITTTRPAPQGSTNLAATAVPQTRRMPSLIDSTEAVARSILFKMRAGAPKVIDIQVDDPKRDGLVARQAPGAGSALNLGDTVT